MNPKILMLGWEFPPIINGGLGIACHDLGVALSKRSKLTMVVPMSKPGHHPGSLNVVGLNNRDINTWEEILNEEKYAELDGFYQVPVDLDPYYAELIQAQYASQSYIRQVINGGNKFYVFNINNLYGGDVIHKVNEFAKIAAKFSENRDFDIIHAHDWMTMVAGLEIKRRTGKPLVLHIHSLEYDRSGPDSKGWVYELEKRGMEMADLIFPVSHFTGNIINRHYGISMTKIIPIHNGIRPVYAYRSPKVLKEKIVVFVGRLTRQKGPEYFLDIASKILDKYAPVRFIMAGTGDHFIKVLEKSAYKKLGNRFHLTGFLNEKKVKQLLSIADVYCMPSISEPFGLSAVEAAQFGIPCVITKQSGVSEVLKGSLQFDFWDSNRAADYIVNLLQDPVLKEKVVSDSYQNLPDICWHKAANQVLSAYQKLLY